MKELYKVIGNYDTTNLIKLVSNHTEDDWNKYRFRQDKRKNIQQRSIL